VRPTRTDLFNVRFRRVWRGYDPEEVQATLRDLLGEFDALRKEIEALERENASAKAQTETDRDRETAIHQALIAAHRAAEETRHAAQEDAVRIVREARARAEAIEQEAAARLAQIEEQRRQAVRDLRALLRSHLEQLAEEPLSVSAAAASPGATIISVPAVPVTPEPPSTNGPGA